MGKRPLTMREIKAKQAGPKSGFITIQNISKQTVNIHLKPPIVNGKRIDFFRGAQDVPIRPTKTFDFRKDRCWPEQIERLCKQGMITILSDSDHTDAMKEAVIEQKKEAAAEQKRIAAK